MGLGTMCGFDWRVSTMISEDGSYGREYLEHSAG